MYLFFRLYRISGQPHILFVLFIWHQTSTKVLITLTKKILIFNYVFFQTSHYWNFTIVEFALGEDWVFVFLMHGGGLDQIIYINFFLF